MQMRFLRRIKEKQKKRNHIWNSIIRNNPNVRPAKTVIEENRLRWFGNIFRIPEKVKLREEDLSEGPGRLGRSVSKRPLTEGIMTGGGGRQLAENRKSIARLALSCLWDVPNDLTLGTSQKQSMPTRKVDIFPIKLDAFFFLSAVSYMYNFM
ncbi:unnamed protein product [Nezara viridula]|uniref:Uncharacterized protein n=1 Tax=Nezara viridula TaxID=85310 RepID=A0A9P0EDK0_NEZVI|nr:unnamed protein product [Nezara viridula]